MSIHIFVILIEEHVYSCIKLLHVHVRSTHSDCYFPELP